MIGTLRMRGRAWPLLLSTIVVIVLAGWLMSRRAGTSEGTAEAWLPSLRTELARIDEVRIIGANDRRLVTLRRVEAGFVVGERNDYPADTAQLRTLLQQFADARKLEAKSARPEGHASLGVESLRSKTATGARIELLGLPKPTVLVIGRTAEQLGGGTFVREGEAPQSWLVSGSIVVEREPERWLEKRVADIPKARLARVELRGGDKSFALVPISDAPSQPAGSDPAEAQGSAPPDGAQSDAEANDSGEVAFVVEGVEREMMVSDFAADATVNALRELDLLDVRTREKRPKSRNAVESRFYLSNGITVIANTWERKGKHQLQLDAEVTEIQPAAATVDADETAGDAATNESAPTRDSTSPPKSASMAAQALNGQWKEWTYVVPPHVGEGLKPDRTSLLKEAASP